MQLPGLGASGFLPLADRQQRGGEELREGREELREWVCPGFGCPYALGTHPAPNPPTGVCPGSVCLLWLGSREKV